MNPHALSTLRSSSKTQAERNHGEHLTVEERACNYATMDHIRKVGIFLHRMAKELMDRADKHDQSKLHSPEVEMFTRFTSQLAHLTYGSPEYEQCRRDMGVALKHHYEHNRHHPEHFEDGINDMNLVDIFEMLCDWKASTLRHNDGCIRKSLVINAERFGISPQLARIMKNTFELLDV